MALAAGTRLGPYEIVAALGAGGMGEVYQARDTRLDRTVALKVLPPEVARDPERRQRFAREARAIASLTHPHLRTPVRAAGRSRENQPVDRRFPPKPISRDPLLNYCENRTRDCVQVFSGGANSGTSGAALVGSGHVVGVGQTHCVTRNVPERWSRSPSK
jgi:serine/threonine protein kinase